MIGTFWNKLVMVVIIIFYNLNLKKNIEKKRFFEKNIETSRFCFRYIGDIDVDHFRYPRFLNIGRVYFGPYIDSPKH